MFSRTFVSILALAGLASNALAGPLASILNQGLPGTIADKYIVVLKSDTPTSALDAHKNLITAFHENLVRLTGLTGAKALGVERTFNFASNGLKGYTGGFSLETITQILLDPQVAYVEQDSIVTANAEQTGATWGQDRTSHVNDYSPNPPYTYLYKTTPASTEVNAYVIDTGIRISHDEFEGRASWGYNSLDGSNNANDDNGHGTHCAGTVGGKTYGIAKKVKLVAVKVLDANGSGSNSGVIAGMNWVANNAIRNKSVASMSLGGRYSKATNDAVDAMVAKGVPVVVAAGNDGANASGYSPASAANAITVGAIDINNKLADFSNYGSAVHIFAPGVGVISASNKGDSLTQTFSGTSMACPHVAGVAAIYLSYLSGGDTPARVKQNLINTATNGQITFPRGIILGIGAKTGPNRIAYNGGA